MIETMMLNNIGELIDFSFTMGKRDELRPKRMNYTFRGQKSEKYCLSSSLRRNSGNQADYAEKRLLNNFKKYGELIEPKICESIWRNMTIAQHHGLPTRCLDFSISPIIALHFALTDNNEGENAVVWAINHGLLHQKLLPKKYTEILKKYDAVSFTVDMLEDLGITIADYNSDMGDRSIVFLEPPSIDSRIANQFSHFAIIPDALDPLDDFLNNLLIERAVCKFIIPSDKISLFRQQLDSMNITERTLFPGLDGIASYLKRRYAYEK